MQPHSQLILLVAAVAAFVVVCGAATPTIDAAVQNRNVDRTIDLTGQNVKIVHKITLAHKTKQPITSYQFVLTTKQRSSLAFISIRDAAKKELKYVESTVPAPKRAATAATAAITGNLVSYVITLPASATGAANTVLYIETVFTQSVHAFPTEIVQSEKQLVRYYGSAQFYTPYVTLVQKTTLLLSSKNVESYTPVKPSSVVDSTLTYGPYDNVAEFTSTDIVVHYENLSPFMSVTRLERVIEVSHWGNIAIEETIDILHTGAKLKGAFSRYDFQKEGRSGQASVKQYKTVLPASASGVYYRDTNGNISTSAMRVQKDSVELDLRPRFPLFGGWRTHYTLGYNVPSFEYLFSGDDQFLLKMRLIDHIYDDMHIDEVVVKIILPEGCHGLKLITPYAVQRQGDTLHYTYLDTFGRPVVEFTKRNLVEQHIHDFNLKYQFSRVLMVQEPLLIVGFLYVLFVLVIVWMRLDFSIAKERETVGHHHRE